MKKDNGNHPSIDPASSEILCKEIREQSEQEAAGILEQTDKEVDRILAEAKAEAKRDDEAILKKAETRADAVRKRILSGVHLEVKRLELRAREELIERIFSRIEEKFEVYRGTKAYASVIEGFIVEGVTALDGDTFRVEGGDVERKLLTKTVMSELCKTIEKTTKRKVSIAAGEETLPDAGVVIASADGRMRFDNRFATRMDRMESRLRLEIAKRMFE